MLIRDSIPGKSNELPETPDTFARKCTAILNSNTETNLPSMLAMAEMAGVSESSLRRRLAEEETTYFRVVDDWRFSWAIRLIQDPQFTLKEITASLRYANLPNFERAFKRWTGITPGQFRNQL